MANRLYPPLIEGTIPAFYGNTLCVPFNNNRSVGASEYDGFTLKIRAIRSNNFLGLLTSQNYSDSQIIFNLADPNSSSNPSLKVGQSYKIQIAYRGVDGVEGYYSTVGVVKYTAKPSITIDNLRSGAINYSSKIYYGKYINNDDPSERIYSYRFIIYDDKDNIVEDSGELAHDNTRSDSLDAYYSLYNFNENEIGYVQYQVRTTNDMVVSSQKYKITGNETIDAEYLLDLTAENNYDNGYVEIDINGPKDVAGAFVLSRKDLTDNGRWEDIDVFLLNHEDPTAHPIKDFTTLQGHLYQYSIQQFNNKNVYTKRIVSNQVYSDFEDAFLYDGKRQLRIRFNPKVSSFKTTLLESKVDTIGGKYPFIFRNGNTYYKEFPISGLISYWMDNDELFMTGVELGIETDNLERDTTPTEQELPNNLKTTNLLNYNIAAERVFKLAVLDWLNDGEIKLFRSPGEGNYIVRILNTSLTPTDSLGRMLHTFNSTAYEICDYSNDWLGYYGFINNNKNNAEISSTITGQYKTFIIGPIKETNTMVDVIDNMVISGFAIEDLMPDTPIYIYLENQSDPIIVHIGTTGSYAVDDIGNIVKIQIPRDYLVDVPAIITIKYDEEITPENSFSLLDSVDGIHTIARTFIGPAENVVVNDNDKDTLLQYADLQFELLQVVDIYNLNGLYYFDIFKTKQLTFENVNPRLVYKLHNSFIRPQNDDGVITYNPATGESNYPYLLDRNKDKYFPFSGLYILGQDPKSENNWKTIPEEQYDSHIYINGNDIDLADCKLYHSQLTAKEDFDAIKLGNGTLLHLIYQIKRINLVVENEGVFNKLYDNKTIAQLKQEWVSALKSWENATADNFDNAKNNVNLAYAKLMEHFAQAVNDFKEERGL